MTDYYSTLGVSKTANPEEIKKAYRKLAAQHHPDRGGDTAKFQKIQEAYSVLSDPEKRNQYDNPQPQGFHFTHQGFPPGFEEMFTNFGGGAFGDIFGQRRRMPRNRHLNFQISVSLEEAFQGKEMLINVNLPSGREQTLQVKIPAGIQDGTTLRLAGMGDDSIPNVPRGDIHLNIHVAPHAVFQRHGDDLIKKIKINCVDAMIGKIIRLNSIDNKEIDVTIHAGTQPNAILSLQGFGMPNINDNRMRGRFLLEIEIEIPKNLTEEQKNILKTYFK